MAARPSNIVGAYDAKSRFSELLELVQSGSEITITRHGNPIARLVPIRQKTTPQQRLAAIHNWRESSKKLSLAGLKIRDLLEEGRP